MRLKSLLASFFVIAAFISMPILVQAQGPGDPGPDPDPSVPFDGGLSLLIAAGVGVASKKAYDQKKKKENGVLDK